MAGNFSDWAPYNNYVQSGMFDGTYANAGFTMLAAGPPRLANIGGAAGIGTALDGGDPATLGTQADQIVHPIGIVQNFNLSHTRQFSRIFEIGSERSYFIGGRTVGQLGLARIYYHGASLLRVLYAYYQDTSGPYTVPSLWPNNGAKAQANPHDVIIPAGYENIFVNLASDLFAQPVGIMMYVRDINQETLGAIYFEACYLPNHTWQTDSQGVLIQESVAIQFERGVPVAVSQLSLIGGANAGGANLTFNQTNQAEQTA
jgi:hypothetical protein